MALALALVGLLCAACASAPSAARTTTKATGNTDPTTTLAPATTSTSTTTTTILPIKRIPPGPPADQRHMVLVRTIGGHISPKSVDASDTGLVFAQNMMYTHTVTVYDSAGNLVKTIPDTVDMSLFGYPGHPGITHGAPVEAAFTPNARYVYVSNYSMYGVGMGPEGNDDCTPASAEAAGDTNSYVYRIDTRTLRIDQVIEVGLVPKFLAVTRTTNICSSSNWCSFNLSVVDIATGKQVAVLPMGPISAWDRHLAQLGDGLCGDHGQRHHPEGRPREPDPRRLVLRRLQPAPRRDRPDGQYLYVSLNAPGEVVKVDIATEHVIATGQTGDECRSLAISTDGTALYVVNYLSDTVTMLRASDLADPADRPDRRAPDRDHLRRR